MNRSQGIIWVIALLINFLLLWMYHAGGTSKVLIGDEVRYIEEARQFIETGTLEAHPFWPVGYSYFLGVMGYTSTVINLPLVLSLQIVQVLLWIWVGWLFDQVLRYLGLPDKARYISLGLFLLYPSFSAYAHYFWPEVIHMFLYLGAAWVWMYKRKNATWGIVFGGLIGLTSSMKLVFLPVVIALFLGFLGSSILRKTKMTFPLLAVSTFAILLLPASASNYKKHGFFFPADSTAFNIWVGLNDQETSDWSPNEIVGKEFARFSRSGPTFFDQNKRIKEKTKNLIREKGLFQIISDQVSRQYFRLFDYRTFLIKQLPGQGKVPYPIKESLGVKAIKAWDALIWGLILVGFVFGIRKSKVLDHRWYFLFIGLLIYTAGIFLILHVKTRYMIPILPLLCLFAGLGWEGLRQHFQKGLNLNLLLRILGAVLLLFLAFF